MAPRSPLEYDVSVAADKRRRQRIRGMSGSLATQERCCDWPDCDRKAEYRAPVSPDQINSYRWYCLEHVRMYNQSWNFFADHDSDEIDAQIRADQTWERPTWKFGKGIDEAANNQPHAEGRAWARWGFSDPMELLGDAATINTGPATANGKPKPRLSREEGRAMDVLGMDHEVTSRAKVRARYRDLVRDLHPDMNGGESADPERLSRVLRAWDILKKSRSLSD
ncbi:J domain-containing protein [Rhodobacteraceae bacterium NNCM2]|nr:J domain-containing protein [Coraliihabitans acroporae]